MNSQEHSSHDENQSANADSGSSEYHDDIPILTDQIPVVDQQIPVLHDVVENEEDLIPELHTLAEPEEELVPELTQIAETDEIKNGYIRKIHIYANHSCRNFRNICSESRSTD